MTNQRIKIAALSVMAVIAMLNLPTEMAVAGSGKATVYSSKFEGKKTASGETYKQNKVTAASKTLPIGSKVKVKNKKTGKSETVTINDREGKSGKGVVDLSKAAAQKIGVKGTAPVETQVISKGKSKK